MAARKKITDPLRLAVDFVKNTIVSTGKIEEYKHFLIRNGKIYSSNGFVVMSSPIPCDVHAAPRAKEFIAAIQRCSGTLLIRHDDNGLTIRGDDAAVRVDCRQSVFEPTAPYGTRYALPGDFIKTLRQLSPLCGNHPSRLWSHGIRIENCSAYATDGIVAAQKWLGVDTPSPVTVPLTTAKILLKAKLPPTHVVVGGNETVSFEYEDGKRVTSNVIEEEFKTAKLDSLFDTESNQEPVPDGLFSAVKDASPFVDAYDRVWLEVGRIATAINSSSSGVTIDVPEVMYAGCYGARQLLKLKTIAKTIGFDAYPNPVMFFGDNIRGAIAPIRE